MTRRIIIGLFATFLLITSSAGAKKQKSGKESPKKEAVTQEASPENVLPKPIEKASLKTLAQKWGDGSAITAQIKSPKPDPEMVEKLIVKHSPVLDEFLTSAKKSQSFLRGEIEEEPVLNALMQMQQLSVLRARQDFEHQKFDAVRSELGAWFLFAADFPYEESSHLGLKASAVLRAFLFDELENFERATVEPAVIQAQWAQWNQWFKTVRAPWPIDRVMVTEGKRVLKPILQKVAADVATQLQKNPYQTAAQVLEKVPGGMAKDLGFLKEMWTDRDLNLLKTEVNRLHRIQLRWTQKGLTQQKGQPVTDMLELAKAAGFASIPVNYLTGKPWELSAIQQD